MLDNSHPTPPQPQSGGRWLVWLPTKPFAGRATARLAVFNLSSPIPSITTSSVRRRPASLGMVGGCLNLLRWRWRRHRARYEES
eukprot:6175448-Pleurochrysis_carterae.AAC.1